MGLGGLIGAVAGKVAGGFLTKSVGGFFATELLGVTVGNIVGAGLGGILSGALAEEPETPDFGGGSNAASQGMLVNKQANDAPIPVVYGQRRVGGTRVLMEATGSDNEYLHIVLALCEGEIESIENVYLNNKAVVPNIEPNVNEENLTDIFKSMFPPINIFGMNLTQGLADNLAFEVTSSSEEISGSYAYFDAHSGADDQAASSDLVSEVDSWTTDHRLRGTAYIYVKLTYDQDAFASGLPTITADVKGTKVYDPRTSTTAWSDNPALCIRDYLTNDRYGRGIDASLIDDTAFNAAANYCEEQVTIGGVTKDRYTLNGVVDTSQGSMDVLKKLLTACRGFLVFSGGRYKLVIDKPETAAFTFSEDNIVGAWSISMGSKNNQFNRIRANFFNPDRQWQPDIAAVDSPALRTQDNGLLLEKTIDLPFTSDIDRAKMITTINLNQSRQQITAEFTATIEGLRCEVGDVVYIKHATPGWDTLNSNAGKLFRVMRITLQNNDEVRILAMEYDATAYDFGTIAVSDAAPNTNLPNPATVVAPTDLVATESLYSTRDNNIKAKVDLSWVASKDIFVNEYEWSYRKNGDSTYTTGITRSTNYTINDIDPAKYTFRVKAINTLGVSSSHATLIQEIAGLLAPPSALTGVSLQAVSSLAILTWAEATDLDVKNGGKIEVRHSNVISGATWSNSVSIGTALAGTATVAVLPLLSGTYIVRAVDSSGVYSPSTTVTTEAATVQAYSTVGTVQAHPNWSGTHDDTVAVDGVLRLQGNSDVDDWASIDAVSSIDLGTTGVDVGGTYTFSAGLDAGSVKRQKLVRDLTMSTVDNASTMDTRTTNIDSWIDFDQTDGVSADAIVYVRTTDDDPTGSPTWSGWEKLEVSEYNHRAFEFKVDCSAPDIDHNIRLSELTITSQEIV